MGIEDTHLRIDCIHVDDEMWVQERTRSISRLIWDAVGASALKVSVPKDQDAVVRHDLVRTSKLLGGIPVFMSLTQAGSFKKGRDLLDQGFYHLVISDAVDSRSGEKFGSEDYRTYSGYKLLGSVPWATSKRVLYTKDYKRLHDMHEIDFIASELGGLVADYPDTREGEKRFKERIGRTFNSALGHAAISDGRFWFRVIDKGTDHIFAEIREKEQSGWVVLSQFELKLGGKDTGTFPPVFLAQYVAFLWFVGCSRASLARNQKQPLPGEKARERGVKVSLRSRASWITALCDAYKAVREGRNCALFNGKRGETYFDKRVGGRSGFWPGGPQFVAGHKRNADHKTMPPLRLNILGDLQQIYPDQMPRAKLDDLQVFTEEEVRPIRPFLPLAQDGEEIFPQNLPATFEQQQGRYRQISEDRLMTAVQAELERELATIRKNQSRPATNEERKERVKYVAEIFEATVKEVRQWTAEIRS